MRSILSERLANLVLLVVMLQAAFWKPISSEFNRILQWLRGVLRCAHPCTTAYLIPAKAGV